MKYCEYYQAKVIKDKIWFLVGAFRNENHVVFDRALEGHDDVLEYFVTQEYEELFLDIINHFQKCGYVLSFEKMPNRIQEQKN